MKANRLDYLANGAEEWDEGKKWEDEMMRRMVKSENVFCSESEAQCAEAEWHHFSGDGQEGATFAINCFSTHVHLKEDVMKMLKLIF